MKKVHVTISGLVQGIFFRHHAKVLARKLGLKGYVRNLSNGNVEVVAQGDSKNIEKLIDFLKKGPSGAKVDKIDIIEQKPTSEFTDFEVRV